MSTQDMFHFFFSFFFFCSTFLEKLKIPHQTVWYVSSSERGTWLKSPCRHYKASTPVHIHEGGAITDTFSYGNKSPPVGEETTGTLQTFGAFRLIWVRSLCSSCCLGKFSWAGLVLTILGFSQWVGGHRGRVRVTEGVRLKVRQVSSAAGKKKKKSWRDCVKEHLLDLVKSTVWHRPPVVQDSNWRWWRFPEKGGTENEPPSHVYCGLVSQLSQFWICWDDPIHDESPNRCGKKVYFSDC